MIARPLIQRKILNAYWTVIVLALAAEMVSWLVMLADGGWGLSDFVLYKMLLPSSLHFAVMGVNEFFAVIGRASPYLLIFTGALISSVLIIANPSLPGIEYTLLLPMIISLYYYDRGKLHFALLLNSVVLLMLLALVPDLRSDLDGNALWVLLFIMSGVFICLSGLLKRMTELMDTLKQTLESEREMLVNRVLLEQMTKVDALTGLYNHKTFHDYLDTLITQSESAGMSLHLAIIDIDNFKHINDTYGHDTGDAVLKRSAEAIKQGLSPDSIAFRYGGEEFAVLITGSNYSGAFGLAETVRKEIAGIRHSEMDGAGVTVSIGLAEYRRGLGKAEFFTSADSMLYEAKRSGKNRTVAFDRPV